MDILDLVLSGTIKQKPRHPKNCSECLYRQDNWRDGGHCYMFREEPQQNFCGQFKRVSNQEIGIGNTR